MNSMYSERNSEAIDFATELLEHSRLSLVGSVEGFTELLTSRIIPDLLDGNITPAFAAETLAQNLSYKLFEAME